MVDRPFVIPCWVAEGSIYVAFPNSDIPNNWSFCGEQYELENAVQVSSDDVYFIARFKRVPERKQMNNQNNNITYSIDECDRDGDIIDQGVFLHFQDTKVKVADSIKTFLNIKWESYLTIQNNNTLFIVNNTTISVENNYQHTVDELIQIQTELSQL